MWRSKQWFVIINPTSGNGSSKRLWPKIKAYLDSLEFNYNFQFTKYRKHSIDIVYNAIYQGFRDIIVVGGDGTIHNIVNAINTQTLCASNEINIGVIAIGTGNDWIKTHNIPKSYKSAIDIIKRGQLQAQDIGRIDIKSNHEHPVFFNNLAGIGFDGYVVSKVSKYKRLGAIAYVVAAIVALFSFRNFKCSINTRIDKYHLNTLMVVVGVCKYSGGGMQLTNNPIPNDGLLDVSIIYNFKIIDVIINIFKLFNGKINTVQKVITFKTDTLDIDTNNNIYGVIEADGELISSGSLRISIIKNALSFYA